MDSSVPTPIPLILSSATDTCESQLHLCRCLETSAKLHQAMREVQAIDALHAAIMDKIAKERSASAERIHQRVLSYMSPWNG